MFIRTLKSEMNVVRLFCEKIDITFFCHGLVDLVCSYSPPTKTVPFAYDAFLLDLLSKVPTPDRRQSETHLTIDERQTALNPPFLSR